MKKRIVTLILICFVLFAAWVYYDFKRDPSPIYIRGRDTVKEWDYGQCEILATDCSYEIQLNGKFITNHNNYVMAYKEVGTNIYFITTNWKIVVDLATKTYIIYGNEGPIDATHSDGFSDLGSFTWLEKIE